MHFDVMRTPSSSRLHLYWEASAEHLLSSCSPPQMSSGTLDDADTCIPDTFAMGSLAAAWRSCRSGKLPSLSATFIHVCLSWMRAGYVRPPTTPSAHTRADTARTTPDTSLLSKSAHTVSILRYISFATLTHTALHRPRPPFVAQRNATHCSPVSYPTAGRSRSANLSTLRAILN
ncbi:hypothetical protein FKP32DRAFT_816608 [Trametes sanguinea]|nr:hypothetical protein FKP32DRAFT_816608 [Trametes sanguinea]